jgi:hypothetical protein
MKKLGLLLVFFTIFSTGQAQLEIGGFVGGSYYIGEINPTIPFRQTNLAYGVLFRYALNARWAVKANVYEGSLTGDDLVVKYNENRSLKFKSEITELAGVGEFNFLPYFTGSKKNYVTPYIFAGVGVVFYNPKVGDVKLRDMYTEGQEAAEKLDPDNSSDRNYSTASFCIPFGIGVKYSFSKRIAATLEWGMRKSWTDYIDDISWTYYESGSLYNQNPDEYGNLIYSDPNLDHEPNMQRGNSKNNDWYSFAGLTLTYNINLKNRNKCSEFQTGY